MKLARLFALVFIVASLSLATAATHTITFSGITYTPQGIEVAVGDVVRWEGDFQTHPLESISVPNGAASFSNSTGTSFEYTVMVAGDYGYRCTNHWQLGMVGGFSATDAGVDDDLNVEALLQLQAYPNPASGQLTLSYTLDNSSKVRISLFDMNGRELYQSEHAGASGPNTAYVNVASLPIGTYYYRLETSEAILARKFTISR
jgi:plastocyanin